MLIKKVNFEEFLFKNYKKEFKNYKDSWCFFKLYNTKFYIRKKIICQIYFLSFYHHNNGERQIKYNIKEEIR